VNRDHESLIGVTFAPRARTHIPHPVERETFEGGKRTNGRWTSAPRADDTCSNTQRSGLAYQKEQSRHTSGADTTDNP
jgi:hypothetical protein